MDSRCSQLIEDIKWFMFDTGKNPKVKNEYGFTHGLEFVTWKGDGHSFICKDYEGIEYCISIAREGK